MRILGFFKYIYLFLFFLLIAGAILYQYLPVLNDSFPSDPETAYFFQKFKAVSWSEILLLTTYYNICPIMNVIQKLCADLFFEKRLVLFGIVIFIHFLNVCLLFFITKRLIRHQYSGEKTSPHQSNLTALFAATFFAIFNSYYHSLANPHVFFSVIISYSLVLVYVLLIMAILESDLRRVFFYCCCIFIAGILPFLFLVSFTFFAVTFILFAFGTSSRKKKVKLIIPILIIHLIGLVVELLFFDARLSYQVLPIQVAGWSPDSFGLLHNLKANPLNLLMITFHTAFSGIQFGLIHQNFLFSTPPYTIPYFIGFAVLTIYMISLLSRPRVAKINLLLWLLIFASLINVCIVRNPLSADKRRIFDAYFVASMPRYYYFPAILLGLSLSISWMELVYRKKILLWLSIILMLSFAFYNMSYTREKIDYLKEHMASEVYKYTPKALRSPMADPGRPSFIR